MTELTANDPKSWLRTVWSVLDEVFEDHGMADVDDGCISFTQEEEDEVKTAMAWIAEELGVDPADPDL